MEMLQVYCFEGSASLDCREIGHVITLKENYNHFLGSTVSNPFEGEHSSTPINIEQGVFVPNDPPGVYIINNMAHYDGVLLSVHFVTEE